MNWRNIFSGLAEDADTYWDSVIQRVQEELKASTIYVQPYLSYGTAQAFYIRGRVLEGEKIRAATDEDTPWENLAATYHRFESDEVANAQVQITIGDEVHHAVTDREGYFLTQVTPPPNFTTEAPDHPLWHEVTLSASSSVDNHLPNELLSDQTTTRVMVPPANSNFGVISDLDDTVLQTHATSLLHMARLTLFHNARTRLPFAGVAEFYQALQRGPQGKGSNPIFYVSSSPWNLYDLLFEFLAFHGIPHGPLFLRDLGLRRDLLGSAGHHSHKLAQVEHLLGVYPNLPFILIGDSGQEDPEIYQEIVQRFPARIMAIYIRDVSLDKRDSEVDSIIEAVGKTNVTMVRVPDTVAAAEHAAQRGLIDPATIPAIEAGKRIDKAE
ncbi:MAG: DUF2183 domain-containing protein [Caldilineaceae bacterium]|nr:DUF2183 domain-containing protein [Caldilineaceae bacterium]